MKRIILAVMLTAALTAAAVPARRGTVITASQPDGTTVALTLTGDERAHCYLTDDGRPVASTDQGYCYIGLDQTSTPVPTGILAHDPGMRTPDEVTAISHLDADRVLQAFRGTGAPMLRASHSGMGSTAPDYPTTGQRKGLVFLVEYADVSFSIDDPHDYFHRLLNEPGFADNEATGSCRDYYIDNSNGLYQPDFDVYGPVTLPEPRKYYGSNTSAYADDKNPQYMMLHAAQALDDEVDFSQYDLDGDGYIDYVFVFFAGQGEADGGPAEAVWPHAWEYPFSQRFDGVRLSRYACSSELMSGNIPAAIGTFCHEFAHVLGLPDLYDTASYDNNATPLFWDVMDQGCYSNGSRTPPCFSSFERNALGWMDDLVYEPNGGGEYMLDPLSEGGGAMLIPTSKQSEYFMFENRQLTGWDKFLPNHGMLVWHIDYNRNIFYNNTVNNDANHQRVDIVEACDRVYSTPLGMGRYTFPGRNKVTELRFGGSPSLQSWAGQDLGYELTDIREDGALVRYTLGGDAGVSAVIADNASWTFEGRRLCSDVPVTVTDVSGRVIARGCGVTVPAAGLYIVSDGTSASKLYLH